MLTDKVFGINRKQYLNKGNIHALCTMSELSGGVICMYMCYLHKVLKKPKMSDMVGFVDPNQIGALGCGNSTERSRHLSVRFTNAKKGQIFMLPYNAGGIKIYNAQRNRFGRKSITWQNLEGSPVQQGDNDCAIFIIRYMKEIVHDKNLEFASKVKTSNFSRDDFVIT